MHITIKTTEDFLTHTTFIDDGKNSLVIKETEDDIDTTTTTITSNGDSIYPIMDLLKIWEATR